MNQQLNVSILVAARNEEVTLASCLESLLQQNVNNNVYFNILIGDDDSEDNTAQIAHEFEDRYQNIKLIFIDQNTSLKGKVNVLDQLTNHTNADYLLFADADVVYSSEWLQSMLDELLKKDIVTGTTIVKNGSLWDDFQRLDWMYALSLLNILSFFKIPVTAMGNNMGIKSKALQQVGGFKNVPFSVAEDFTVFKLIIQNKGTFSQLFSENVLAITGSVESINGWLHQRWRWMQGAKKIPFALKILNYLNVLIYPLLFLIGMKEGVFLSSIPVLYSLKLLYLIFIQIRLKVRISWKVTLLFDFMYLIFYASLLIYGLNNPKISWKGRLYKSE